MALTDAVAAQIMGELHELTKKIEEQHARTEAVAKVVVDAAKAVENGKAILHKQNEAFLMTRVKEITQAITELKGMEGAIQSAAKTQADVILSPLYSQMSKLVDQISRKDKLANEFLGKTSDTQKKLAENVPIAIIAAFMFLALGFTVGHYLHW